MSGGTELGRENFSWIAVRCCVRAEVEEELQEGEADDKGHGAEIVEVSCENADYMR